MGHCLGVKPWYSHITRIGNPIQLFLKEKKGLCLAHAVPKTPSSSGVHQHHWLFSYLLSLVLVWTSVASSSSRTTAFSVWPRAEVSRWFSLAMPLSCFQPWIQGLARPLRARENRGTNARKAAVYFVCLQGHCLP